MFLCVVGNCLLFYCSCTGNCENCCGINGSINDKIEIKLWNNNNDNNNIKDNKVEEEKKIEEKNKEENKEEKQEPKIEEVKISDYGKIDDIQIVSAEFAKEKLGNVLIKKLKCKEDNYKELENEFMKDIDKKCGTHLSAYVEVKDNNKVKLQCFVWYKDANSKKEVNVTYGLFQGSEATKIEILSCGNNIENMRNMFSGCSSLTNLDLSSLDTKNVTNMRNMFYGCSNLTELDLSKFNTSNVTDMGWMFNNCSSLTILDLSNFNTDNVKNMLFMFNNCFPKKQTSMLICTASTIQKITTKETSYLKITDDKEEAKKINDKLKGNLEQVCTCSVKRVGNNPEITEVVEYQITSVVEYKQK